MNNEQFITKWQSVNSIVEIVQKNILFLFYYPDFVNL